jgi:hypothetical protein
MWDPQKLKSRMKEDVECVKSIPYKHFTDQHYYSEKEINI